MSGEKSQVLFTYTPSYTGRLRFSAWNALNHSLSFNASRHFGRWKLGFSAAADLSNLSEFLFSPTVFASVAAVPGTFSDLAAAVLTGTFTNAQFASLLTGAPIVQSPARNLFFGERMFTSAAQTSLSYTPAPRLSVKLTASGSRSQHLSDNQGGVQQNSYLIPMTTSAGADLSVSYSRSPRTQLGGSVSSTRVVSTIQDVYSTTAKASLGRTMGRRWFLQLSGGVGYDDSGSEPPRVEYVTTTRGRCQPGFSNSVPYVSGLLRPYRQRFLRAGRRFHFFGWGQLAVGSPRPFLVDREHSRLAATGRVRSLW